MATSKSCVWAQNNDKLVVRSGIFGAGNVVTLLDRHGNGTSRAMVDYNGNTVSVDLGNYEMVEAREVPAWAA